MKATTIILTLFVSSILVLGCKDDAGKTVIVPRKRTFPLAMADAPTGAPAYTVKAGQK